MIIIILGGANENFHFNTKKSQLISIIKENFDCIYYF